MFTCRKELEEIMHLKHPRKVLIEETMEIPRAAERFFRGVYREPEKLKRGFADLQRETSSLLDLLNLRRNRFRDWFNELPGTPGESLRYIKDTAAEFKLRHQRAISAEAKVLQLLEDQEEIALFPVEEEVLGKWSAERILLFTKVIEKIAGILKLPVERFNKVVLVHMMSHVLIYAGEDRDQRTWARHEQSGEGLEALVHYFSGMFYRQYQYQELAQIEEVFIRHLAVPGGEQVELANYTREQVSAALIFWRRKSDLTLQDTLTYLRDFT